MASHAHTPDLPLLPRRSPAVDRRVARLILGAFTFTFLAARILVLLIMTRTAPDLYFRVGSTHVHHLNYGIFLLSLVGAYLLMWRPTGKALSGAASLYGVGLALTFDEFGMWLHLGGSYWQWASFDAIVIIAALLGLIVVAPSLHRFRPRHWTTAVAMSLCLVMFAGLSIRGVRYAQVRLMPLLDRIEAAGPQ